MTVKDIAYAAAEGYDSIELSKRYTTVTMGPSQGRFSQLASIRALGAHDRASRSARSGMTTARPPWSTGPDGRARRPPVRARQALGDPRPPARAGATVKWAGDWRRAYDYGDPEAEALAVHDAAGVIDVSTLGKLLVRGPDAGELLDRLYPNRISNLKPGRVRYGVMTSRRRPHHRRRHGLPAGRRDVLRHDDVERRGAIEEWFGWWLADWDLDARVTDVTQGARRRSTSRARARARSSPASTDARRLARGFAYLDARHAHGGGRGVPAPADRLRRRGRLRDPLPGGLRRARVGRARGRRARARSGSSRSASCACRSCT